MEWPIVATAPIVTENAVVVHDVSENPCQGRHVQHPRIRRGLDYGRFRVWVFDEPLGGTGQQPGGLERRADHSACIDTGGRRKRVIRIARGRWVSTRIAVWSAEAIRNPGGLVFVAYGLWHLTCLPDRPDRRWGLIHSMGEACRQQGRAVLQRLFTFVHERWSRGVPPSRISLCRHGSSTMIWFSSDPM